MKKSRTLKTKDQAPVPAPAMVTVQMPLPMLAAMSNVTQDFQSLCIDAGRQVLSAMMEQERTALCGPKWIPNPARQAGRHGNTHSLIVLGGRQIEIKRPRVRSGSAGERELPSFQWAAARDPLDHHTMEAIACGVSTRNYPRTLDPITPTEREVAISSSAVSRRFVAMSAAIVSSYLSRPLDKLELRVIMIDGIAFGDHLILIALGVSAGGEKIVLGVREGTTESAGVVKALLSDLIERGLSTEKPIVFVIDGAKGLRAAIVGLFGKLGLIHRCQVHKLRNVLDHLPEALRPGTQRAIREAYDCADAELAHRRLEQVARSLEREHPGAAASLREGLADTLTLSHLKVGDALYRSLRSTNLIENLNGSVAHFARNVRRWRDGTMIVRWVASAVREAEKKFRRLKGYKQMPQLLAALDAHAPSPQLDMRKKAA
jgi:putative transposase